MQRRTTYLAVILLISGCGSATDADTEAASTAPDAAAALLFDARAASHTRALVESSAGPEDPSDVDDPETIVELPGFDTSAAPAVPSSAPGALGHLWERWSRHDHPRKLDDPNFPRFEYRLSALPLQGEVATVPWVGSYFPAYLDSINYRWAGAYTESAAHKYQRAFGGQGLEKTISKLHGVDHSWFKQCTTNAHCSKDMRCGKRSLQTYGRCVPFWWGICHAWAAASTLHPEPRHAVFYNDVRFEVQDIKALLSIVYDTASTTQVSLRCEEPPGKIPTDRSLRPTGSACRDTNPGTYHVLLANFIGLQRKSFIEDRTIDRDVWNQPIRSFKVLKMHEVGAFHANRLLGISNAGYPYNSAAAHLVYVQIQVKFIKEAKPEKTGYLGQDPKEYTKQDIYQYLLELDANENIIGGEWLGRNKLDHPDFVWIAHGPNTNAAAKGLIKVDDVLQLARLSVE